MAKIKKDPLFGSLSGSVGNFVFRQLQDGTTVVSRKPDFSRRKDSPKQLAHQDRFKQATAYAREAQVQPAYAEMSRKTGKPAYNWALADWMKPPVIQRIERKGETVRVFASDNIGVTEVRVAVRDEAGNLLEEGPAWQPDPAGDPQRWEYVAASAGTVEAAACDLAGNRTKAVLSNG